MPTRVRHFYTGDEQENEALLKGPTQDAWLSDGVIFYVWPPGSQPPDAVPVYRFGSRERGYIWAVQDSAAYQAVPADEAPTGAVVWYVHQGCGAAGATIEGGVFRWRPSREQRGDYQINIIGSDGQLESCQSVIIRVTAAPSARTPAAQPRTRTWDDNVADSGSDGAEERAVCPPVQCAGIGMLPEAAYQVVSGVAQDLMVVFFVPWLLGLLWRLRYQAERTEQVLIVAVVVVNAALILGRRVSFGPGDDRRYALGMIALTIFYVPVGIEVWRMVGPPPAASAAAAACRAGLVPSGGGRPPGVPAAPSGLAGEQVGYREAATWLRQNTKANDMLAVRMSASALPSARAPHVQHQLPTRRLRYHDRGWSGVSGPGGMAPGVFRDGRPAHQEDFGHL
jgi:hypothetical protein